MLRSPFVWMAPWLIAVVLTQAAPHRATRLGHPATRFAPPLHSPEDLRARFRDEKLRPDIASILQQAGWIGDLQDIHRAAATAPISEVKLPVGTRMPFMSSRENGRPIALRDVIWEGKEPISAYVFEFNSKGRRYRCITPKPCSNFFVVDQGPIPWRQGLQVTSRAPAQVSVCDPVEIRVTVRNTGETPLTRIRMAHTWPAGVTPVPPQANPDFDAGPLAPGEAREFSVQARAAAPGMITHRVQATAAEGVKGDASSRIEVRAPVLTVECRAPAQTLVGRPAEICLTLRNTGNAPEPKATVTLPIPTGAVVERLSDGGTSAEGTATWEFAPLEAGASRQVCAFVSGPQLGDLVFAPSARGTCAALVTAQCSTRRIGIPAILIDAVDLEDPVEVGKEVTYVIKVTNQGSAPGTNVRIVGTVPEQQEFISGSGITPLKNDGRAWVADPVASLAPKAVAEWRIVVKALHAGDVRFAIDLSSDQFQMPIPETESTRQY